MKFSDLTFLGLAAAAASALVGAKELPPHPGFRLIQTGEDRPAFWVDPDVAMLLSTSDLHYMDITDVQDIVPAPKPMLAIPDGPRFQDEVNSYIARLSKTRMENTVEGMSSFHNRYFNSNYGAESAEWLFDQVVAATKNRTDITVEYFSHSFMQPSIVCRMAGTDNSGDIVVIGGHQDSTASGMPSGSAPGADDDASGSAVVLEALTVFVEGGFKPTLPVEFHWYAGEEGGLLGSADIAKDYASRGISVRGMAQFDMTGYDEKEQNVAFVTDYTDPETTEFSRSLVEEYLDIPHRNTLCGYGCSDHASWNRNGYRSIFPFEASFSNKSPYIHTTQDTINRVSFDHVLEFAKLAVAFAVELSHP